MGGIHRRSWMLGLSCMFFYLIMGMGIVANLIGFMYPAYKSFKSLKTGCRDDDTQWLIYWIVYSLFTLLEMFTSFLLGWIPFYHQLKLGFLIWLSHDSTKGAQYIYQNHIEKFLDRHEDTIDDTLNKVSDTVTHRTSSLGDLLASELINRIDGSAASQILVEN